MAETTKSAEGTVSPPPDNQIEEPKQPKEGSLKEADKTSAPGPYKGPDAPDPNDPPVRAALPDVPIIQTLTVGAGAHDPPDPEMFDIEGRPIQKGQNAEGNPTYASGSGKEDKK